MSGSLLMNIVCHYHHSPLSPSILRTSLNPTLSLSHYLQVSIQLKRQQYLSDRAQMLEEDLREADEAMAGKHRPQLTRVNTDSLQVRTPVAVDFHHPSPPPCWGLICLSTIELLVLTVLISPTLTISHCCVCSCPNTDPDCRHRRCGVNVIDAECK